MTQFDYSEQHHIEEMQKEYDELQIRLNGLSKFVNSKEFEKRIQLKKLRDYTIEQKEVMEKYLCILGKRIEIFNFLKDLNERFS